MLSLFAKRTFLDPEDETWHRETWKFLLKNFGGLKRLRHIPLVNATREFFPPSDTEGHERAEHIFGCVKRLAGLGDWPCALVAQPDAPNTKVGEFAILKIDKGSDPAGTFSIRDGVATITYNPASVNEPAKFVATMAHELAHYLLTNTRADLPGGEDMHEFATDLTTVFLGFGLFSANQAFNFTQHGDAFAQGWRSSSLGYLRERDWAFALAVFLALRKQPAETLAKLLKPHLYADLRAASKYLGRHPRVISDIEAAG